MEAASVLGTPPPDMSGARSRPPLAPIPSRQEKGFLDEETPDFLSALGHKARRAVNFAANQRHLNSRAMPRGVVVTDGKDSARLLITDPDPELGVNFLSADNDVLHPGLSEFGDFGSALRLHVAHAERHPERRVITNPTVGVSHAGRLACAHELAGRCVEKTAALNLRLLRQVTHDGPVRPVGVSLGSYIAAHMVEQNMSANPKDQLRIDDLVLIASAVVAVNVDEHENFRSNDLDEAKHRDYLTNKFFEHIVADLARMTRKKPLDTLACAPIVAAYASAPHKALPRLQAIRADFKSVQNGVEWSMLKHIAANATINVLGGALDPLIIEQIPQWEMLGSLYPRQVRQRILPDLGHLMTIDAKRVAAELDTLLDNPPANIHRVS